MDRFIHIIREVRKTLINSLSNFSIEQFNKVPEGFNNNIIWNLGHMVATQQSLCYKRAGLPMLIDDAFFDTYKADSKPERFIGTEELEHIKQLALTTMDQLEKDLKSDMFFNYTAFTTRYGISINNIEEAVNFLPYHEGLHFGTIKALIKLV